MTVDDRTLPELPCFTADLKLRYSGVELAAMPKFGMPSFTTADAVNSLMQQVAPALAQIKAVGDLVSAILALVKFAEAVPNAVKEADPSVLNDGIKAIAGIADKIAPHVPFIEHAVTVFDALNTIKVALAAVSSMLEQIQGAFSDAADTLAQAEATGNDSLRAVAQAMEARAEAQVECAKVSVGLVLKPLEIVSTIAENIPAPPSLPEIPDLSAVTVIDELIDIVDQIHDALEAIV